MYMRRKIDAFLQEWKNNPDHLPLLVKGARQIGKTRSILEFAECAYSNVICINFALETKYLSICSDGYDVDSVIHNISFIDPSKKFTDDTVIIFDEIQDYPDIATSLKSFKLDGRFDVICSGSLLGVHYKKIHSNSVGYKTDFEMYSMDFEEFLWAKGYSDSQISEILASMIQEVPFSDTRMNALSSLFLDYCVLGGMPAVVKSYIETGVFSGTVDIQNQIRLDYEEDVRKYVSGLEQTRIINVYRSVPAQLAKEYKKFQYSGINKNARARDYAGCIEWLKDAGVISVCYCLHFPELPLKGNVDTGIFKLYYPDTGLLISSLDTEAQEDLRENRNLGVYKGALYENFVAEALLKQGLGLYYFKKENSTLEEDFFVRSRDSLIPLEVKSNNNRSKSQRQLINSDRYRDIRFGIRLSVKNIGYSDSIYTLPYFCAFLLKRYIREKF